MPGSGVFDASTPLDAQTKPWRVSAIRSEPRVRTMRFASRRIDLDAASVAVPGELARAGGRLDLVQPHDPALDLRNRLLCDDEDVPVLATRLVP